MARAVRGMLACVLMGVIAAAIGCPDPAASQAERSLGELVQRKSQPSGGKRGRATVAFLPKNAATKSSPSTAKGSASNDARPDILFPAGDGGGAAQIQPGATGSTQHVAAPDKEQQPLFQGWPKPKLAIVVTGQQHGYIEPCGCTGLANQKGGMSRRHTFFKQLRAKGWELAPLDVGGQVRRPGPQAEAKYKWTTEALVKLGYKGVAYGGDDVVLSSGELAFPMLNAPESPYPFLGSNVSVISSTPTHRVLEVAGMRLGITAVLGDEERSEIRNENPGVEMRSVDEGLKDAWAKLSEQRCNFHVLIAHASVKESREIAKRHPHFHLVVTTGLGEPERVPERVQVSPDKVTLMVQAGNKAMYVGVVGLFESSPAVRYERVPLDDRFEDSAEMLQILKSYQAELKERGLKQLGAVEVPHVSGKKFVGSSACQDCHSTAYEVWSKSGHGHATDSIVDPKERAGIERHHDPECLSCHVTGWAPQEYTPYSSGYLSLAETPHLKHNGCENCHGPGSRHVAIENGDINVSEQEQAAERSHMRLPLAKAKAHCVICHDQDNSPDFFKPGAFEAYWKKIEHIGKD